MSSGLSSDRIVKNQIIQDIEYENGKIRLRIFPEGSNDDQIPFVDGGLTFGLRDTMYGSCDAVWYIEGEEYFDRASGRTIYQKPVIALEGTDALQRGSSGNAQYQRFHHALGAVREGIIGIYYLKPGNKKLRLDLYEMAYSATKLEKGTYLITQDLQVVEHIIKLINTYGESSKELKDFLEQKTKEMHDIWVKEEFNKSYKGDWQTFADNRSTIIQEDSIIKYCARNKRNFTDSSQRAGHIAVGEMYLSKYFFIDKKIKYLFLRLFNDEKIELDSKKATDKEWHLLRTEKNVEIKTVDDLIGLPQELRDNLIKIKDEPLKNGTEAMNIYKKTVQEICKMIKDGSIKVT